MTIFRPMGPKRPPFAVAEKEGKIVGHYWFYDQAKKYCPCGGRILITNSKNEWTPLT